MNFILLLIDAAEAVVVCHACLRHDFERLVVICLQDHVRIIGVSDNSRISVQNELFKHPSVHGEEPWAQHTPLYAPGCKLL